MNAHSFPSGKLLTGAHEPLEVHQIFPRASLDRYPDRDNEYVPDRLGNLTLLVRSDNEHIGETAPDVYLRIIEPRGSGRAPHSRTTPACGRSRATTSSASSASARWPRCCAICCTATSVT